MNAEAHDWLLGRDYETVGCLAPNGMDHSSQQRIRDHPENTVKVEDSDYLK